MKATDDEEVLSGIVRETLPGNTPGVSVTRFSLSGEPHASALVRAVGDAYPTATGRPLPDLADLAKLAGQKVSILRCGDTTFGSPLMKVVQGTIFLAGPTKDRVALLPKGKRSKGYGLDGGAALLDFEPGYLPEVLRSRALTVRDTFPALEPLTDAHLAALPERAEDPAVCTLAVFGTWEMPDGDIPGALWLLHSYMREEGADIVEGVLLIPPQSAGLAESEHGSTYGRQLLRSEVGKVARPVSVTLADALRFCNGPDGYAAALRAVRGA